MKETGINRSLAHASGSVGMVRGSVGRRLPKIFRSLKRQRESDSRLRSLKRQRESDFRKPSFRSVFSVVILVLTHTSCRNEVVPQVVPPATPRLQPGTEMGLYAPEQHDLHSGRFVISTGRVYQVDRLDDPPGWDHVDNRAETVHEVEGSLELDVNEIENTGSFRAQLTVAAGDLVIEMDRFHEFSPCQDGGIAAFIYEHGDSGCGDTNWPKSLLYVAGWGFGHATLNGETLYEEFQIHFMVTQRMRNRETLQANYPY